MGPVFFAEVCSGRACFDVGGGEWEPSSWVALFVFTVWALGIVTVWVVVLVERCVLRYRGVDSSSEVDEEREVEPCRR